MTNKIERSARSVSIDHYMSAEFDSLFLCAIATS
jgi:hypothetical protein